MEEDRNMYPLFIQINSPYCLWKLKSTNSHQVSAETGRMNSTMRVKVSQVGPQSGRSERLSHKDFLSQVISCNNWAVSQSRKTWTAGVDSAGPGKHTLVIRLLMGLKHKGLWPPAVTSESVLCSLVSRGKLRLKRATHSEGSPGASNCIWATHQKILSTLRDHLMVS